MFQSIRSFVVHDGRESFLPPCFPPDIAAFFLIVLTTRQLATRLADVINKLLGNSSWPIILLGDHGCKLTRLRASPLICNSCETRE